MSDLNDLSFHFERDEDTGKWTGECNELSIGAYADTLMEVREYTLELVMLHLKAQQDVE